MFLREKELGKKHVIFYILPVCLGITETLILKEEMSVEVSVGIKFVIIVIRIHKSPVSSLCMSYFS